ncbi:MAG: ABC transporter ATP-binding protein [Alphaproteobacteria bacterium]|nr:ABC transporter ATP-binding protein [Alphaproteobacteria bacterium]MCB9793495.1 ABC transporter ATP-binding protein [Alphaproteobacteria bacterium]
MVEADKLTKRYGPFTAVEDVSFTVGEGEILGFIGPNGAGKTTTMRILTGFLPATEGRAVVAGFDVFEDPMEVKRRVGYLPETPPLYRELTVEDYLGFVAELRGVPRGERLKRIGDVMERVGLRGWERRILGSLSKGYRQRVGLAQALVHNPKVLILDEPTSGLDPAQNVGVRELIASLAGDHTVILSTHILREVEALASRVVLINQGKIAAQGSLDEVRAQAAPTYYRVELTAPDLAEVATAVGNISQVEQVEPIDGVLKVTASLDPRPAIAALAVRNAWEVQEISKHVPSLEEAFLAIVGREGR